MQSATTSNILKYSVTLRQTPPAPVSFTSTTNTQTFTLFGIPARHVVCGIRATVVGAFTYTSGPATNATIKVGVAPSIVDGLVSIADFYIPALNLGTALDTYFSPFSAATIDQHLVTATVLIAGPQSISQLITGELQLTFLYRAL